MALPHRRCTQSSPYVSVLGSRLGRLQSQRALVHFDGPLVLQALLVFAAVSGGAFHWQGFFVRANWSHLTSAQRVQSGRRHLNQAWLAAFDPQPLVSAVDSSFRTAAGTHTCYVEVETGSPHHS